MYIIIYDFGTGNVKTCLFEIDSDIRLVAHSTESYALYTTDDGGAEQDTEERFMNEITEYSKSSTSLILRISKY